MSTIDSYPIAYLLTYYFCKRPFYFVTADSFVSEITLLLFVTIKSLKLKSCLPSCLPSLFMDLKNNAVCEMQKILDWP